MRTRGDGRDGGGGADDESEEDGPGIQLLGSLKDVKGMGWLCEADGEGSQYTGMYGGKQWV